MTWSTAGDVRAAVERRWKDGTLLRAYADHLPFPLIDVPLRGPRAAEIGERLDEVQTWSAALRTASRDGRCFTLQTKPVGGRLIGRNELPARAIIHSYGQAWALLGVSALVRTFDQVLATTSGVPAAAAWVRRRPLAALELAPQWPTLVSAYVWLDAARGSGRYLREITAPGVDTKYAERHRSVLAELLGVSSTPDGFLRDLGLQGKPKMIRTRPDASLGLLPPAAEVALRPDDLAALDVSPTAALVLENEITYLSVPVPPSGIVLWGKGFDVDLIGRLPWLRNCPVTYWGDLDTHGFAILNQLRAWLPHTRSVLMDSVTLLEHRQRWTAEQTPTRAPLGRLTEPEASLYRDLVEGRWGDRVRLEQERIDWAWALARLGP